VYNTSYIVKEPQSPARVNWHQDLTYWGLSDDDAQVSAWIALAPATVESGCMRMIPGSHRGGKVAHVAPAERRDDDVLQLGQFIAHVDDDTSVYIPLEPGEASLHHGWTVHASSPNVSTDRRIGLNVQFLAPHCRQVMHDGDTALLVRGEDRFHHFGVDTLATVEVDLSALERQRAHEQRIKSTYSVVRDQR
jgi:ectoine hydroxylase-related dioxygenase (phytanoyl-CoA dioxygenase family)